MAIVAWSLLKEAPQLVWDAPGAALPRALRNAFARVPSVRGAPLRIAFAPGLRSYRGKLESGGMRGEEMLAAAFPRERRIVLDSALQKRAGELRRIAVHELFHFAWIRLSNGRRRSWETLLAAESVARARGELGWSAESRKRALTAQDRAVRSRRWREYCCESFCDTAAFLYAGLREHPEFTLALSRRARRAVWFEGEIESAPIRI